MLSLTDDELAAQSVRPRSRHETFSPAARSLQERKTVNHERHKTAKARTEGLEGAREYSDKQKSQGAIWKQRDPIISSVIDAVHMKNLGWTGDSSDNSRPEEKPKASTKRKKYAQGKRSARTKVEEVKVGNKVFGVTVQAKSASGQTPLKKDVENYTPSFCNSGTEWCEFSAATTPAQTLVVPALETGGFRVS